MKLAISWRQLELMQVGGLFSASCLAGLFTEPPSIVYMHYNAKAIKTKSFGPVFSGIISGLATLFRNVGNMLNMPKHINPAIAQQWATHWILTG